MTTTASNIRQANAVGLALVCVIAANALLVLSAKIQVPFWPVPMTMQTLVVVALGLGMGMRLGTAAMLLYLVEGAIGLPVFAGTPERGIGLAYMAGPTGGYLAGFLLCTIAVGWLADRGLARNWAALGAIVLGGHALILACGALWPAGRSPGWPARCRSSSARRSSPRSAFWRAPCSASCMAGFPVPADSGVSVDCGRRPCRLSAVERQPRVAE